MGKKYDAWQQSKQALEQTNNRVSDVSGGSTEKAYGEALTNQTQAAINERDTYDQWQDDPKG